ncbi:hypothetical protein FDUTEX481_08358 [Tolypothrix sp. PCC 7601]|nr:hypothetical protein FDUTEX481_08358 [Tolypothrix sp. PCC 7601]
MDLFLVRDFAIASLHFVAFAMTLKKVGCSLSSLFDRSIDESISAQDIKI